MSKKILPINTGFAHIEILFVILAIAVLGVTVFIMQRNSDSVSPQATPTPYEVVEDEISDWETYKSSIYSVKYPSDFQFNEESPSTIRITRWGTTQQPDTELYDGISLYFEPRELPNVTPQQFAESHIKESVDNGTGTVIKQPTPYVLGAYSGVEFVIEGLGTHQYIILKGDNEMLMQIINSTVDPQNLNYQSTVDQILSTFRFSDPAEAMAEGDELQCVNGGGAWIQFANGGQYCQDQCNKPASYSCLRITSFGCDCGANACWNGTTCVPE